MHKNHFCRSVGSYIIVNFDLWLRNPRTVLMAVFIFAANFMTVRTFGRTMAQTGYSMHYAESIARIFMTGFNGIALYSLTFLVMISEMPRRIPFQQYTILRGTRMKWIGAQILYCFLLTVTMLLIIFVLTSVFLLPYTTQGNGWSDDIRIMEGMDEDFALVPTWIRENYSPWQAFFLSVLPVLLFWLVMVLTVLLFSLIGAPSVGIAIYCTILFSSIIFYFESFQGFESPMTFSTLMKIVYQYEKTYTDRLATVFSGYALLIAVLVTANIVTAKNMDVPIYALNKN